MTPTKKPTTTALISDIHGNQPALEAVLEDSARRGAGAIWNLGDILGYAPFPNKVIKTLRDIGAANIIGNYDQKVLAFAQKRKQWKKRKPAAKYAAFHWNDAHLLDESRAFLESLPEQVRCPFGDLEALLVHGSPASIDELLGAKTPRSRLAELAELAQADLIVCGHSHEPFTRRIGRRWFVNPGSVGRPEGGDWRASYATMTLGDKGIEVEFHRVGYDVDRVARAVHAAGLPAAFIDVFRQAKSLDQLWCEAENGPDRSQGHCDDVLLTVVALAERCHYEAEHTRQVTKLALEIFDGVTDLHRMGSKERFWLQCGAMLHDIGWMDGRQGHHKTAMRLIMAEAGLALGRRERQIVALVARYHRKALPSAKHKYFVNLSPADQHRVGVLAGILRVADGLDRSHAGAVRGLRCEVSDKDVAIICEARGSLKAEIAAAQKKADLFQEVFGRPLTVRLQKRVK